MAQTENFNRENVLKALADIVDEFGADYVYTDHYDLCKYANEAGEPACIVGQVVARVAPETFEQIKQYEAETEDEVISFPACLLGDYADLQADTDRETIDLFNALMCGQVCQDGGGTWGKTEDEIRAMLGEGPRHGEA